MEEIAEEITIPEVENTQPAQQEQVPSDAQINWSKANEALKYQKQRIEELERMMQQKTAPPIEEPDEFDKLDPDDVLTVGQAKNLARKFASKEAAEAAKKAIQEYAQQQYVSQDETRMRAKHEDYDYVIENFAIPAINNDPVLAYKIQQSKNPAEAAYKWAKMSDQFEGNMTEQKTSPKAEKILKNTQRPVSSAASGSPLKSQADSYAKMSPQEIWKESQRYAKGA
jgi:hypothetical protein